MTTCPDLVLDIRLMELGADDVQMKASYQSLRPNTEVKLHFKPTSNAISTRDGGHL